MNLQMWINMKDNENLKKIKIKSDQIVKILKEQDSLNYLLNQKESQCNELKKKILGNPDDKEFKHKNNMIKSSSTENMLMKLNSKVNQRKKSE